MTNATHIFIPSDGVEKERHAHNCPICKRIVDDEPNAVCQKVLKGTGLDWHHFPCVRDVQDWRNRFGIDDLMDALLEPNQVRRFIHEVPNAKVAEREQREIAAGNEDLREIHKEPT